MIGKSVGAMVNKVNKVNEVNKVNTCYIIDPATWYARMVVRLHVSYLSGGIRQRSTASKGCSGSEMKKLMRLRH